MDSAAESDPKTDVGGTVPQESNAAVVPPGEEQFEPLSRSLARGLEPSVRQTIEQLGRDTPEAQKLLGELEWETSPIPPPTKPEADGTQLIDVRLLEPSPLHHRTAPSTEEQRVLERSIAANGLQNPIEVRPQGEKFEITRGHRRVEAYRNLFHLATSDSERAKYKAIRAKVVPASDLEAVLSGITDDLVREEFPPADAARSIHMLRYFDPKLRSAPKLAGRTGLAVRRIRRFLQLGQAPLVIQAAVRDAMTVQVEGEDGSGHEEVRKLSLLAGLEFKRLHAALSNKDGSSRAAPEEDDDNSEDSDAEPKRTDEERAADRKIQPTIERALLEDWSFREVKRYVDKAISALDAPAAKKGKPRVPFKWSKRRLQVDVDQVGALDVSQKEQLRAVIQEILTKL